MPATATKSKRKAKRVSYRHKPSDLGLHDWQSALRRQAGRVANRQGIDRTSVQRYSHVHRMRGWTWHPDHSAWSHLREDIQLIFRR